MLLTGRTYLLALFLFPLLDFAQGANKLYPEAPLLKGCDTVVRIIHDTLYVIPDKDWREVFGFTSHSPDRDTVWGKPVEFYINKPNCSVLATDFYYGDWRPSCNGMTSELLGLATTDDRELRPFYRWCLFMTIKLSDGCLSETIGEPARRYAEKFPQEFFEFIDADLSGKAYLQWTEYVGYSGFYSGEIDGNNVSVKMENNIETLMLTNCQSCNIELKGRIKKFAKDCYSITGEIEK